MMKILLLFLSCIAVIRCGPLIDNEVQDESVLSSVVGNLVNCVNNDFGLCLKEHALKASERLSAARKLDIVDGLTLYNNNPREAKSLEGLSTDVGLRKQEITDRLWENAANFIQNTELQMSYNPEDEARSIDDATEEGRGKKKKIKKKLKLLFPLALILKAKALLFIALALSVVAFSLFKISVLAKLALIWKIIEKLKHGLGHKSSTIDVWASPQYSEHDEHSNLGNAGWGGPYARSSFASNDMAYAGHKVE